MKHSDGIQLRAPSQGERFKWFAISHFTISIFGVIGMFLSALTGGAMVAVLFLWEAVLLALYAFAGRWIARKRNWCRPTGFKEGFRAFFSPALVAWIWGGVFLLLFCIPRFRWGGMGDARDIIVVVLMYSLLFLAFPSSCGFFILALFAGGLDADISAEWGYMIIVGGIPPLLFVLGSLWGGKKQFKTEEEKQEIEQERDMDV